jgi:GTP-binding protein
MKYPGIDKIRNIAIIAHVDHGKTTLVDCMLRHSGLFRANETVQERILDSNELERERGITILAKNISIDYKDYVINVVDTPGHADFGGEVERVLGMVDGALLIVDAAEGPMPQTRFVLSKALQLGLKIIVVINKIDRQGAEPHIALDRVFDLFLELTDNQDLIDFPVIYTSSVLGISKNEIEDENSDFETLFQCIINNIKPPGGNPDANLQFQSTTLDYNDYVGRIAIGRIHNGFIKANQQLNLINREGQIVKGKVTKLIGFKGLGRLDLDMAVAGDIIGVAGFPDIQIGETLSSLENPEPLELITIEAPTLQMNFSVNDSPFAGTEGTYVTSRQIRKRLFQEMEKNVSLKVEETENTDVFRVSGRGELHLSVLIETMRREGYEFQVSKPKVIFREVEDEILEPFESIIIDVPDEYSGSCIEKLAQRKAEMINMTSNGIRTQLEFIIPTRGLIGFRGEFIRMTKGNGIMHGIFKGYYKTIGEINCPKNGVILAFEDGEAIPYALEQFEDRGIFFIKPRTKVYRGMIVGEHNRPQDLLVNVCKTKKLTNMRSATADTLVKISAPREMSLEDCLEYIREDELIEITPKNIRMRKANISSIK